MRIAFIAGRLSRRASGVKVAVEQLSGALVDLGHEVHVFGIADDAWANGDSAAWAGAPVSVLRAYGLAAFGYTPGLEAAVRAFAPDIVHTHGLWMYGSLVAGRLARAGLADVISPHGMLDPWALKQSRLKKRMLRAAFEGHHLARARAVHALNAEEAEAVHTYGIQAPVAVLPNGVELAPERSGMRAPPWAQTLPEGAKTLLFFGRLHPKKNLTSLINAWAKVQQAPWHLVIAGPDQAKHRAALEMLVAKRGLASTVHLVGPQYGPDKDGAYAAADAFILPSYSEGLPMAVLEAWSWRLPVLMSQQCNLPAGFEAGAAVDTGTEPDTIAYALSELIQMDDSRLAAIGSTGRSLVEQHYSWHRVAEGFSRLYAWCKDASPGTCFNSIAIKQDTGQE